MEAGHDRVKAIIKNGFGGSTSIVAIHRSPNFYGSMKPLLKATAPFVSRLKPKIATKIEPISEAVLQLKLTNS